jgi:hypothetical protein
MHVRQKVFRDRDLRALHTRDLAEESWLRGVQPTVLGAVERGGVGGKALVTGRSEHAPLTCRSMGTAKAPSGAESTHFVDTRAVSSSAQLSVTWI